MASNYNPSIVTSGLVLALDAGNTRSYLGSGATWTDLSGNANHCTLFNTPTYNASGYFTFNGTNHYGTVGATSTILGSSNFTFTVACYKTSSTSTRGILFSKASNYIDLGVSSQIMVSKCDVTTGTQRLFYGNAATQNVWKIHTVSYDGSNVVIYENGAVASTTASATGLYVPGGSLYIGNYDGGGNYYFTGNVAVVHCYNSTLTAAQVLQNYNALRGRFGL